MDLGRVGIWSFAFGIMPAEHIRDLLPEIESLGFRTLWYPESFTREAFAFASFLLGASDKAIAATGIANMWARDATAMANGAKTIQEAFPDRFVLGIGVSHPPIATERGGDYRRPYSLVVEYLDAIKSSRYLGPEPKTDPPLLLAALGPKMLDLAGREADGAHPYFVPVEHTRVARDLIGPNAVLAPEQAVVLSSNPDQAKETAHEHVAFYLSYPNYRNNLLRMGWSEDDVAGAGSDALVESIVASGDVEVIRDRVAAHLDAGADHVSVQVLTESPKSFPITQLREIAPALMEL